MSDAIVVDLFVNMGFEHPERLQIIVVTGKNDTMSDTDLLWLNIFLLDK